MGVDVFFVISGFLISLNIFQGLEQGDFSIADFYRRRLKRIVPAMLAVVFVTFVVAQVLLLPEDAVLTAQSALWAVFSFANVYFWLYQDTGYFAPASTQTPLLHLWSLGVEEQFYLLWPLILFFTYRQSKVRVFFIATAFATLTSFLFGEYFFEEHPSFVYYLLPARAGELLTGAMVALAVQRQAGVKVPQMLVAPMAGLGLLLLIGALTLLSDKQVFPGILAIPPTLGTALLLFSRHCRDTWVSRLLSVPLLVGIGLISYSAYLWHWPLLAFYRYGHAEVSPLAGMILVLVSLGLAWWTYRYVEQPARHSTSPPMHVWVRYYVAPVAGLIALAIGAIVMEGYGTRWLLDDYKQRLMDLRQQTLSAGEFDYVCQRIRLTQQDTEDERCVLGAPPGHAPRVILWGDSNAAHYVGMIGAFAQKEGFRFRNVAIPSCPPLNSDPQRFVMAKSVAACRESAPIAQQAIDEFPVVIMAASWSDYASQSDAFLPNVFDTVRALTQKGKLVVLIGKAPVFPKYDRRCLEKTLGYPFLKCSISSAPPFESIVEANSKLRMFAEMTPNVAYFDVIPHLCKNEKCSPYDSNGTPQYFDAFHISQAASWKLGNDIVQRDGVPTPFKWIANSLHSQSIKQAS